jgi:hypothetical protein
MPILGIIASQISGHLFTASAYDSIATTTIGSGGATSITFNSIPSSYTHLQVRGITRNAANVGGDDVQLRINADSGTNYDWHEVYASRSTASVYAQTSGTGVNYMRVSHNTADASFGTSKFNGLVIDILDYANTSKNTTVRTIWGADNNATGYTGLSSGLWLNTSAVTSLTIYPYNQGSNNFAEYTQLALYGIKAA